MTERLLAAASPNGNLMAVLVSASPIRVGLLQTDNGDLQTTLTTKEKCDKIHQVLFLDDTHVAALLDDRCVVVWDLVRGVVAYTYQEADRKLLTIAASENSFWVLAAQGEKLQVHLVTAGKLTRKIKAGKTSGASTLAVEGNLCVIVNSDGSLRVLDSTTGSKVCKASLVSKKKSSTSNSQPLLCMVGSEHFCTAVQGNIVLVNIQTGKVQEKWSLPSAAVSLQSMADDGKHYIVVNETHVYQWNQQGAPRLQQILHVDPAVNRSGLVEGDGRLWAVLQQQTGPLQLQTVALQESSKTPARVTISYKKKEDVEATVEESKQEERGKRRAVVLGPGQAGGEARQASEGPSKKSRKTEDDEDSKSDNDEGPTIAQRLEQLQKDWDEDEDNDGDEDKMDTDETSFQPRKATTESLTELLQQALQSRDDGLLELALSVKDVRIVEKTCQSLDVDYLAILVTAISVRLASKPNRAEHLCQTWLRTLLRTGKVRSMKHLQPLRNILHERTEVFPALLQLEGKLSVLGSL